MLLSDSELKRLKVVSAGDSLYVVVEPVGDGGGNSFVGRTRFPPGRPCQQVGTQSILRQGCRQMDSECGTGKVGKHLS